MFLTLKKKYLNTLGEYGSYFCWKIEARRLGYRSIWLIRTVNYARPEKKKSYTIVLDNILIDLSLKVIPNSVSCLSAPSNGFNLPNICGVRNVIIYSTANY
jgi:hypothetical protein